MGKTTNVRQQRRIVVGGGRLRHGLGTPAINLCSVSQVRTVETVLKMIVDGLVEKAGFALARIWLIGPGDICAACPMGHECPSRMRCLHLAASAGRSQVDGQEWKGVEGFFRRIPLGVRKIGQVGSTGNSFLIPDAALNPAFAANPDWVRREGIHGFAGHPLIFREEILGVVGAFGRIPFHESTSSGCECSPIKQRSRLPTHGLSKRSMRCKSSSNRKTTISGAK